ncbi:MAG: 16S rRNA (cytidine(1402)-2'-O)-methyltransferase [Legionella sp.]|nr:16S rRNA (cytidine(1402)-2'-O)-methyltransferase [Legionella sp.]
MEKSSATFGGILYIVATPIGNLQDISLRAIDTLKTVDSILAEDTRHSLQLLNALGIQKPLLSLHAHNEQDKSNEIITALQNGQSFALISDAGTPLISDPGFVLVRLARKSGIQVVPIPGACALITALCAAGVPCDSFTFAGFLPAKEQARKLKLLSFKTAENTVIIYESTHRIIDCINDIIDVFGEHYQFVLAKELTKSFEHFMQATGSDIKEWLLAEKSRTKGEFVLIFPVQPVIETISEDENILSVLLSELPLKQAVKLAQRLTKSSKNDLYAIALQLQKSSD